MQYLYIYAASDFETAPPDEAGSAAAGTAPFSLTLKPGATPITLVVDDADGVVDEVNSSTPQVLAEDATVNGVLYPAGTSYHSAYDLLNSSNGHQVTSVHFGGSGYQQGAVDGMLSSVPLEPGVTYSFDSERTSHRQANYYDTYEEVPCFTAGAMIDTPQGPRAIETLRVGDLVRTADHGAQPIRWIGRRVVSVTEAAAAPALWPVSIAAGAMGAGLPQAGMRVSQQHRMLVASRIAQRMFGVPEVLVAARALTGLDGVSLTQPTAPVVYYHMLFERHEIVFAHGAPTESLFAGPQALKALGPAAAEEIFLLFPELRALGGAIEAQAARPVTTMRRAQRLAVRHGKNSRPLLPASAGQDRAPGY